MTTLPRKARGVSSQWCARKNRAEVCPGGPLVEKNHRSRNGSSKMREARTKKGPKDTMEDEKVVTCIIEVGQRPKVTKSGKQFVQGVENNSKIVIANLKKDEFNTFLFSYFSYRGCSVPVANGSNLHMPLLYPDFLFLVLSGDGPVSLV